MLAGTCFLSTACKGDQSTEFVEPEQATLWVLRSDEWDILKKKDFAKKLKKQLRAQNKAARKALRGGGAAVEAVVTTDDVEEGPVDVGDSALEAQLALLKEEEGQVAEQVAEQVAQQGESLEPQAEPEAEPEAGAEQETEFEAFDAADVEAFDEALVSAPIRL